jgi:hypothetical protein
MNRKAAMLLLASLLVDQTAPLAALAGGAAFVGIGSGSNVSTGVSVSSRRGGSTASISIRVGNRWVPTPWNTYLATPLYGTHYQTDEGQPSGTDSSGALYVNGYRVTPSGWLRVQVEPRDAEILVDGSPVPVEKISGMSNSLGLLVGRHHVQVRKDGYETYHTELPIPQANEVLLQILLKKMN